MLLALSCGCADWSYDRIQLGMPQVECARRLAENSIQRTDLGFCRVSVDPTGRTDALVILLARDGLVAGKLQATARSPDSWWRREPAFRLRGKLDPRRSALSATGPVDALRAIIEDLAGYRGAKPALQAYAWVAAGLIRLVERWPHVGDVAPAYPHLTDTLERVPGGGEARVRVDRRGVYSFDYRQGPPP